MTNTSSAASARPGRPARARGPSASPDIGYRSVLPEESTVSQPGHLHAAVFDRRWLTTSVALLRACGEIDASNAAALTDYALTEAVRSQGVILDLHGLSFCGTEGFVALHRISVSYAVAGTPWTVIAGPAVSRLLAMCDPTGALPHASTLNIAMIGIQHQLRTTHRRGVST